MRIAIFGAGGMLGRDLVRSAGAAGHEVTALDRAAADVTDATAVETALRELRPEAVVNCAAYTAVDAAEEEPEEALRVNAHGAANVARAAAGAGATVVYPSTDYVFDGAKRSPYVESDAPNPLSSYGRSKLAGERATAEANSRHHVARSSWLFGLAGRNFVETMLALGAERDEVVVVDDQVGCPTHTGHLAGALIRVLASDAFGVRHLAAAGRCSWYEFAVEIFAQAGVDCRVLPCTTAESGRPAPRPAFSALETERAEAVRLPGWREGLAVYLAERKVRA